MPRARKYETNADRQAAYRERKRQREAEERIDAKKRIADRIVKHNDVLERLGR